MSSAMGPTNPGPRSTSVGRAAAGSWPTPKTGPITPAEPDLIRRLLAERMGVRAIARVTGVSRSWVQGFVNRVLRDETPPDPGPPPKSRAG